MRPLQLQFLNGHLFVNIDDRLWLLDTGSPASFGCTSSIVLDQREFHLADRFMAVTAETLSALVGVNICGLLGVDILNSLDLIVDAPDKTAVFSTSELGCDGSSIDLEDCMGVPIVPVAIGTRTARVFLDTGAQFSYLRDELLVRAQPARDVMDFHPAYGEFRATLFDLDVRIGETKLPIQAARTSQLPPTAAQTIGLCGVRGILGSEILRNRITGYFPRRRKLVLGKAQRGYEPQEGSSDA